MMHFIFLVFDLLPNLEMSFYVVMILLYSFVYFLFCRFLMYLSSKRVVIFQIGVNNVFYGHARTNYHNPIFWITGFYNRAHNLTVNPPFDPQRLANGDSPLNFDVILSGDIL